MAPDNTTSSPLRLDFYAGREGYTVDEEIALTDARVRRHVSYAIAGVFLLTNILTLFGVAYVFIADNANIRAHAITAPDRVITPAVVMTIVGATTVQLGALALTMGKYLFPAAARTTALSKGS